MPAPDNAESETAGETTSWDDWVQAGRSIEDAEEGLLDLLGDPDAFTRSRAALGLGLLGGDRSVTPLASALRDDLPLVAMEAAAALGRLGRDEAIEPLCEALDSGDVNVRANAATALGRFDARAAGACLERALRDPDPFVRSAAAAGRR
jgi:HEAT repeat protein